MDEPTARFNHILSQVGGKSFLLAGETDHFEEESERRKVASSVSIFCHEAKIWKHKEISIENRPPGLRYGGYVSHGKIIYSFGGRHDTEIKRYNTLHKFDTEKLEWSVFPSYVNPQAELPMPKAGCDPVIIDDMFCLFGGYGALMGAVQPGSQYHRMDEEVYPKGYTNEFHIFDIRRAAMPFWKSLKVVGDRPPPCSYYTMNQVDSKRAVMFGGDTKSGRTNDVYIMTLDGTRNVTFERLKKYGLWPKERSSHAACVINYNQDFPQLLVTGGLDVKTQPIGDLWLLNIEHKTWTMVAEYRNFLERWQPALSCVNLNERESSVLLFGGVNRNGQKISLTTVLTFNKGQLGDGRGEELWLMNLPNAITSDSKLVVNRVVSPENTKNQPQPSTHINLGDKVDMINLASFPTPSGTINILQRVGSDYKPLMGNILLKSEDGQRIKALETTYSNNVERIVYDMFQKWCMEHEDHTWKTLVFHLRQAHLTSLASDIENSLI